MHFGVKDAFLPPQQLWNQPEKESWPFIYEEKARTQPIARHDSWVDSRGHKLGLTVGTLHRTVDVNGAS